MDPEKFRADGNAAMVPPPPVGQLELSPGWWTNPSTAATRAISVDVKVAAARSITSAVWRQPCTRRVILRE